MKRHIACLALAAFCLSSAMMIPPVSAASPVSAGLNYTFSEDSDGIKTRVWNTATLNEENPWNISLYQTRIDQQSKSLDETTAVVKYRTPVNELNTVTLWLGASQNDIRNFYSYAAMYDGPFADRGHFWFSHGKESLGTITAYEQGTHSHSTGLTLQYKLSDDLNANIDLKYTDYSDGNNKNKAVFTLAKQLNSEWKVKAGYLYDSADHKATGIYYVPVDERAAFIGGEWSVPVGEGKLLISGNKSFSAKNSDGSITRHDIGAEFTLNQFSAGIRYDKAGDYWAHRWNVSWRQPL